MRTIEINPYNIGTKSVNIGKQLENGALQIVMDMSDFVTEYGTGTATLVHQRSKDEAPYVVMSYDTSNGSEMVWLVSSVDTLYSGYGQAELRYVVDDVLVKTSIINTKVLASITADISLPDALEGWYDAMITYIDGLISSISTTVATALQSAKDSGEFDGADGITYTPTATATTLNAGADATAEVTIDGANANYVFGIPKGADGRGITSIDYTSSVDKIDTYTVTYSDNTTCTFEVINGSDGEDGITYTPTASATTLSEGSEATASVTIDGTNANYVFGIPKGDTGEQGEKGDIGDTPVISASATVDNTVGTPSVTVTQSGTTAEPSFMFGFTGLKGEQGEQGEAGETFDDTDLWEFNAEMGVHNLLKFPYSNLSANNSGIQYTVNNDGVIIGNGTSTSTAYIYLYGVDGELEPLILKPNKYILSLKTNIADATMVLRTNNQRVTFATVSANSEMEFEISDSQYTNLVNNVEKLQIRIYVKSGTSLYNAYFYPMIRCATDTDTTWQPYAMSNYELTVNKAPTTSICSTWDSSTNYTADKWVIWGNYLYKCKVANSGIMPPNTTYWTKTTLEEILSDITTRLTALES